MGEIFRKSKGGKALGWYLRWYEGGRRRVLASKQSSHAEAKRMLIEIEARIARGEVGLRERASSSLTVAQLIEQFVEKYDRPKVKDPLRYRQQARSVLRRVLPILGTQQAEKLQTPDIARLRTALLRTWAPGSVKLTLNILSSAFSWAMREGLCPANPCRGVERPSAPPSLDFLSHDEVLRLLGAAESGAESSAMERMLHIGIALALHTGLRKGEILGLRWSDLDLDARRLSVARSYRGVPKSGKARHLRIPLAIIPLLHTWRQHCPPSPSGAVLPIGRGADGVASCGAMLGLPRLLQKIGLGPLLHPWHALRHTFASHFVMAGGNLLALQKILGHSDLKQTLVYAHLGPEFLDGEMDKVSFAKRALR